LHRAGAYRTADGGRTFTSIAGNLPANGPVKVVREDLGNPEVLYAGTEFGLWLSVDRGRSWSKLGKLPTVAVDDILLTPKTRDVVATHGRSLYVIDDVRAIGDATRAVRASEAHLFQPRPAVAFEPLPGFAEWTGSGEFRGENPPAGALLTYYIKELTGDPVKISIAAEGGRPIANLTGSPAPGINRISWDLKPTKDVLTEYGGEGQKYLRAGRYTVMLTYGKAKSSTTLEVTTTPGLETR
jgi:hypothetical protein